MKQFKTSKKLNEVSENLNISNVRSRKIKRGDSVEIINKDHVGYGQENLTIIRITKHRHKNIILYEVQNDNSRFYCEHEDLKKINFTNSKSQLKNY